jgi:hypothetical protein
VLLASNPSVETWKLNLTKSKFTSGPAPKEEMVTIQMAGDQRQVTVTGTEADGSAISLKYEMPDKGGIGKILAGGPYDAVSGTRIDDNTREVSYVKGGKEMLHVRTVVSKDGKTLTITGKGTDPQGKPVSGVSVWENNSVFLYQQRTLDGVVSRSREEYDAAS